MRALTYGQQQHTSSSATRCLSREELDAIAGGAAVSPTAGTHLARAEHARSGRRRRGSRGGSATCWPEALRRGFMTEELAECEARYPDALGYRCIAEVARGGQGVVYPAEQTATGQVVAIKALHAGRSGTGGLSASMARARFVREIQIAASLQHGGLVRVLDSIILGDGRDAIIMEWIDGTPMDEWADARRSTDAASERLLLRLVADAADAVAYAHQRGVIHRDLKPSNVLVDAADRAHVLDFGVAWRREDADKLDTERLTLAGEFTGTLAFAAPEQVSGEGQMPDTRTDVYALGVIAFRVLTGTLPYDVDRSLETAIRNITHAEAPARFAGKMSQDAWMVVCKAMSKDPARRYQTASDFAADLRRVADGLAISARADSRLYVLRKAAKRHRVAIGFGMTVLIGLVGMLASLSIGNARLSAALRESRMQQLRTHTAVGARDRAEDILWEEVASSVPPNIDARRALWEGPTRQRELLWSFIELQAEATCVDVLDFARAFSTWRKPRSHRYQRRRRRAEHRPTAQRTVRPCDPRSAGGVVEYRQRSCGGRIGRAASLARTRPIRTGRKIPAGARPRHDSVRRHGDRRGTRLARLDHARVRGRRGAGGRLGCGAVLESRFVRCRWSADIRDTRPCGRCSGRTSAMDPPARATSDVHRRTR